MAIELKDIEEKAKTEIIDRVIFGEAKKINEKSIQIKNFLWNSAYIHYEFLIDKSLNKIGIELHLENDEVKGLYTLLSTFYGEFKGQNKFTDCEITLDPTWRKNRGRLRLIPNDQEDLDLIITTMSSFILETEKRINEELSKSFDIDNFIKYFIDFYNDQTVGQKIKGEKEFNAKYYNKIYKNLKVHYSFGKGITGKSAWISFLSYNQKPQLGIYPAIVYSLEDNSFILYYGVSNYKDPNTHWEKNKDWRIFNEFDVENILNDSESIKDNLDKIIQEYHSEFTETSNSEENKIELQKEEDIMTNNQPLNQILYGPPGTGKTYNRVVVSIQFFK